MVPVGTARRGSRCRTTSCCCRFPPYAPELNPVGVRILRANFLSHRVWDTYDEILDACSSITTAPPRYGYTLHDQPACRAKGRIGGPRRHQPDDPRRQAGQHGRRGNGRTWRVVAGFQTERIQACDHRGDAAIPVITPINWRAKFDEIDFAVQNAGAQAIAFEGGGPKAGGHAERGRAIRRIVVGGAASDADETTFDGSRRGRRAGRAARRCGCLVADALHVRHHRQAQACRAAIARAPSRRDVAQNLYGHGERTLGVMPLYHTMGVRSLLAMSLIGGAFVCLPRFVCASALALEGEIAALAAGTRRSRATGTGRTPMRARSATAGTHRRYGLHRRRRRPLRPDT